MHEDRRGTFHALGAHVQAGDVGVTIRDLDTLAVLARQLHAALEYIAKAPVELRATRRAVCLQPLGREKVRGGAVVLVAGRDQAAACLVLFGQAAQLVGHVRPGFAERLRAGGVGLLRSLLQRRAHGFDLADLSAHLDRQIDREVPYIVGREVLEHSIFLYWVDWPGARQ